MVLRTRLTERFGVAHPIISAPMGLFAGGRLAAAVSSAGGLGLIGGGYGDSTWLREAFADAGNTPVGCGFITWSLARKPELLDEALGRSPKALMLSFGSPVPFAERIKSAGVPLICQVQTIAHARAAIEARADVIVAQGGEAGGHGGSRATLTLVPEIADLLAREAPNTVLAAAGGIADGRGLAAALMLGADGVLVGSRFLASAEATAPEGFQRAIIAADGDATVKTHAVDVVRGYDWPDGFSGRALNDGFVARWHGREEALAAQDVNADERERFWSGFSDGDTDRAGLFVGEAAGLIHDVQAAGSIINDIVADAERLLVDAVRYCSLTG